MLPEIGHVRVKIVLGNGRWRTGFHMDYPNVRGKLNNLWLVCIIPASKDNDCYLGFAQFACEFVYIYTFMPPASLLRPGVSSGDVWTLSIATE
jgi:hypothetical protein